MCLAVPGRVIAIEGDGELRSARVDFGGVTRESLRCLILSRDVKFPACTAIHRG
jgi:hydrogenase maturation factor